MRDLQPFFGNNDQDLKRRVFGGELALAVDERAILFGVHLQTTPAQGRAHPFPDKRRVFADSASKNYRIRAAPGHRDMPRQP